MGSWDYYCALCGSTFSNSHISKKPRTDRFFRARRYSEAYRQVNELNERNEPIPDELQKALQENQKPDDDDTASQDSMSSFYEDYSYDPEIITEEEAKWTEDLICVGFNPESTSINKAFLSGVGRGDDLGNVEADGDDPNFPDNPYLNAYWNIDGEPPVYPFHPHCFDVFHTLLAHETGSKKLAESIDGTWEPQSRSFDKDILYSILDGYSAEYTSRLRIKYGDPEPPQEQFWQATPGEELFIADPTQDNGPAKGMIADAWHHTKSHVPLHHQPRSCAEEETTDIFTQLPFELLLAVVSDLDALSLISLMRASAHIYRSLDSNISFWLPYSKKALPWFFELHAFLETLAPSNQDSHDAMKSKANALEAKSFRDLIIWADKVTTPRKGLRGPFMGIANRRRIWSVCKQIVYPYICQVDPSIMSEYESPEAVEIRNTALCLQMPACSAPSPKKYESKRSFWVKDWADVREGCTLKAFWNVEAHLVGLGVIFDANKSAELRLFGADDSQDGNSATSMNIDVGDWISGFILYYPDPRHNDSKTNIVGITVLSLSGTKTSFGNIESHNLQRLLAARPNMAVVGLTGNIGYSESTTTGESTIISHLGIMEGSPERDPDRDMTLPEVEMMSWADDCCAIFGENMLRSTNPHASTPKTTRTASSSGVPIWDVFDLRMQGKNRVDVSGGVVAYEPLIWAKDANEARALRKLTGYVKEGGDIRMMGGPVQILYDIHGIRAEYAPGSNISSRQIGNNSEWEAEKCVSFDIDGANGEVVSAVEIKVSNLPLLTVKLITNREREIVWGREVQGQERDGPIYTAPSGEAIIGVVASYRGEKMKSFSIISVPMA